MWWKRELECLGNNLLGLWSLVITFPVTQLNDCLFCILFTFLICTYWLLFCKLTIMPKCQILSRKNNRKSNSIHWDLTVFHWLQCLRRFKRESEKVSCWKIWKWSRNSLELYLRKLLSFEKDLEDISSKRDNWFSKSLTDTVLGQHENFKLIDKLSKVDNLSRVSSDRKVQLVSASVIALIF